MKIRSSSKLSLSVHRVFPLVIIFAIALVLLPLIEGRLNPDPETGSPRTWTRQDGTAGASFEVTASQVRFLSTRGETESYQQSGEFGAPPDAGDDDIPF